MKLKDFERKLRVGNVIEDLTNIQSAAAELTTLTGTTATYTTVKGTTVSGVSLNAANGRFGTKIGIPSTAYTGSAPDINAIYVTASYLFVGDNGSWASAALA